MSYTSCVTLIDGLFVKMLLNGKTGGFRNIKEVMQLAQKMHLRVSAGGADMPEDGMAHFVPQTFDHHSSSQHPAPSSEGSPLLSGGMSGRIDTQCTDLFQMITDDPVWVEDRLSKSKFALHYERAMEECHQQQAKDAMPIGLELDYVWIAENINGVQWCAT